MNKKYQNILNELISSYYDNTFDDKVNNLLLSKEYSKDEIKNIISSLCGVSVKEDGDYIYNSLNVLLVQLKKMVKQHVKTLVHLMLF